MVLVVDINFALRAPSIKVASLSYATKVSPFFLNIHSLFRHCPFLSGGGGCKHGEQTKYDHKYIQKVDQTTDVGGQALDLKGNNF